MDAPWTLVPGEDYAKSLDEARAAAPGDPERFQGHVNALRRAIRVDPLDEFSEAVTTADVRVRHTEDDANGYSVFMCYRLDLNTWTCELRWVEVCELEGD